MIKKLIVVLLATVGLLFGSVSAASAHVVRKTSAPNPLATWCLSVPFTNPNAITAPDETCYFSKADWKADRDSYPYLLAYDHSGTFQTGIFTLAWVSNTSCNYHNHFVPYMPQGWNDQVESSQTADNATGCKNHDIYLNAYFNGYMRDAGYYNPANTYNGGPSSENWVQ